MQQLSGIGPVLASIIIAEIHRSTICRMSLLAATWTGAAATVILACGAIFTAIYAVRAFRKQSRGVALLEHQADDQRRDLDRQAEDRRRAQASRVYVTLERHSGIAAIQARGPGIPESPAQPPFVIATVHNTSEQPVYDVRVHFVTGDPVAQAGAEDMLGVLAPRKTAETKRPVPGGTRLANFGAVAYYRDAAGARWTLTPDGGLGPVLPGHPAGSQLIALHAVERSGWGASAGSDLDAG
jgi:hypothetical protein